MDDGRGGKKRELSESPDRMIIGLATSFEQRNKYENLRHSGAKSQGFSNLASRENGGLPPGRFRKPGEVTVVGVQGDVTGP
jgi:hypothetical protein